MAKTMLYYFLVLLNQIPLIDKQFFDLMVIIFSVYEYNLHLKLHILYSIENIKKFK